MAMTEEEFESWRAEGDERCGRCPFCNAPGWIVGDTDWCPHYVGSDDLCGSAGPQFDFLDEDPFFGFLEVAGWLQSLGQEEVAALADRLTPQAQRVVEAVVNHGIEGFWLGLVPAEVLSVDVSESLMDTTYFSYFVQDMDRMRSDLATTIDAFMAELDGLGAGPGGDASPPRS